MPIANIGSVPDVVTATVIASDWGNAIGSASRGRVVQRFNTPAERDASITAPVAGMLCYVLSTNLFYGYRNPGGWTVLIGGPRDTTHARVYQAGAWNSATGSPVGQGFDTVDYDPLTMWSSANRRFTVPVAGIYLLSGLISVSYVAGSFAEAAGLRNGTAFAASANANNGPYSRVRTLFTGAVKCAAGDTLGLSFFTNPGACTGNTGPTETYLAVDYLGTG